MIAFDTDVLVEILRGNPAIVERAARVSSNEQSISIVVVEEILRARFNAIRQAEAGNLPINLPRAYELFERSLKELRHFAVLLFTSDAESIFHEFRGRKIRVATHDLRIAAICVAHQSNLFRGTGKNSTAFRTWTWSIGPNRPTLLLHLRFQVLDGFQQHAVRHFVAGRAFSAAERGQFVSCCQRSRRPRSSSSTGRS